MFNKKYFFIIKFTSCRRLSLISNCFFTKSSWVVEYIELQTLKLFTMQTFSSEKPSLFSSVSDSSLMITEASLLLSNPSRPEGCGQCVQRHPLIVYACQRYAHFPKAQILCSLLNYDEVAVVNARFNSPSLEYASLNLITMSRCSCELTMYEKFASLSVNKLGLHARYLRRNSTPSNAFRHLKLSSLQRQIK